METKAGDLGAFARFVLNSYRVLIQPSALCVGIVMILTAAQKPQQIPAEYQGSWTMNLAYCNDEGATLAQELYIGADYVGFHTVSYTVKSVKLHKGKLHLRYFKLADAFRVAPKTLVLSKDKTMLNNLWYRCPEMPKKLESM